MKNGVGVELFCGFGYYFFANPEEMNSFAARIQKYCRDED